MEPAERTTALAGHLESDQEVREAVREHYAKAAAGDEGCWGPKEGTEPDAVPQLVDTKSHGAEASAARSAQMGYTEQDLLDGAAGVGSNIGEGCGNPMTFAALMPGETVLDLGSGAGFDSMLASRRVGPGGLVIGVDMTPEMLARARKNAKQLGKENVSFRLGEIEHLPCADGIVDCVISNCVINLSVDQPQVYREAFRVLRPGGRLAVSDVVQTAVLPEHLKTAEAFSCWVSGAKTPAAIEQMMLAAGFARVEICVKEASRELIAEWVPGSGAEDYVVSANITAWKAGGKVQGAAGREEGTAGGHDHAHAHEHDPASGMDAALQAALLKATAGMSTSAPSYPKVRRAVEAALGRALDNGEKEAVQEFLMERMSPGHGATSAESAPPPAPTAGVSHSHDHDHGHGHGHGHEHGHDHDHTHGAATAGPSSSGECCGGGSGGAAPQPAAGSSSGGEAGCWS